MITSIKIAGSQINTSMRSFEYLKVKMLEMFHLVEDVHGQVNNVVVAQVQGC